MISQTAKNLNKLFDLYPVDLTEPSPINEKMKEGLARLYADEGLRIYLENAVRVATSNAIIKAVDEPTLIYYRSRIEVLMQLLAKGREHYTNFEKINNKSYAKTITRQ